MSQRPTAAADRRRRHFSRDFGIRAQENGSGKQEFGGQKLCAGVRMHAICAVFSSGG